jgi:4a-hydroxytetrahydrobiopterin dehydratase
MAAARKLSEAELAKELEAIPEWQIREGMLHRDFKFSDFAETFAFMTKVALLSEKQDHHPNWSNAYNKLSIDLFTHSLGGISQKDFDWAHSVSKLYDS